MRAESRKPLSPVKNRDNTHSHFSTDDWTPSVKDKSIWYGRKSGPFVYMEKILPTALEPMWLKDVFPQWIKA